VPKSRTAKQ